MTSPTSGPPARGAMLAVLALVLALAAPVLWVKLMDQPLLRSTGLPAWIAIALAAVLAIAAWRRDRRILVRLVAAVALLAGGAFTAMWFTMLQLPPPQGFGKLGQAPDFMLPDHAGRRVALRDPAVRGPTLLVFQRGHW